jgi:hypothetical protein
MTKKFSSLGEAILNSTVIIVDGESYKVDYTNGEMLEMDAEEYCLLGLHEESGEEVMFYYHELVEAHELCELQILTLVTAEWD